MYFDKNTAALLSRDPRHAHLIARLRDTESPPESELILTPSADGLECGFSYQGIWLHDPKSPSAEAKKAFKATCKPKSDRVHVVLGLGLGYALEYAIANSLAEVIVYESNLSLLRFAMDNVDLHELWANPRVQLACNLFDLMTQLRPHIYSDYALDFFTLSGSTQRMQAELPELINRIKLMITDWARDYVTVQQFHPQWLRQLFENFPGFAQTESIDIVANRFADRPAVVIARGPSLDAAIPNLLALKDAAVLVSAGAALHRLYAGGITPDFAIFYDANAVDEQLHGLPESYLENITFVVCTSTQKSIYTYASRGKLIFFGENNTHISDWMDKTLGHRHTRLEGGGTVSVIALQLAYMMGCRDIALIGQDLAFPNNQVYAGGIALQKDASGNMSLTPSETLYTKPHKLTTVPGQNGDLLETTVSYAGFVRHFEALSIQFKQLCPSIRQSNSSLGGAKIEGYELRPLSDFVALWDSHWKQDLPAGLALQPSPILDALEQKQRRQKLESALIGLKTEITETILFCETLRAELPTANVKPKVLEDAVWESTQRLFIHTRDNPFIGYFVMFDLIPYKQRFLAFADAETFNPGIVDDLSNTLERTIRTLKTQSAVWVEQALTEWGVPVNV